MTDTEAPGYAPVPTIDAMTAALVNPPSETAVRSTLDPLAVGKPNKKGVPYAPGAARGHVVALGMDADGNAYFAVPTYETIRLNPAYARDHERMHELVAAASDGGLYDVAVRAGKEISGTGPSGDWSFRPTYVADMRKAPDQIDYLGDIVVE